MNCRQCGKKNGINPASGLCAGCAELQANPDGLSRRTHIGKTPFKDMKKLDEPARIRLIAEYLKKMPGAVVAVLVDTGEGYEGKGDRYLASIRELLPTVELVGRSPVVTGGEMLKVRLPKV